MPMTRRSVYCQLQPATNVLTMAPTRTSTSSTRGFHRHSSKSVSVIPVLIYTGKFSPVSSVSVQNLGLASWFRFSLGFFCVTNSSIDWLIDLCVLLNFQVETVHTKFETFQFVPSFFSCIFPTKRWRCVVTPSPIDRGTWYCFRSISLFLC